MVAAEVANTLSIFGGMKVIAVLGVVEGLVTPKRVDGLVFTCFKSRARGGGGGERDDCRDGSFEEGTHVLVRQRVNVIICEVAELKL